MEVHISDEVHVGHVNKAGVINVKVQLSKNPQKEITDALLGLTSELTSS